MDTEALSSPSPSESTHNILSHLIVLCCLNFLVNDSSGANVESTVTRRPEEYSSSWPKFNLLYGLLGRPPANN
jgi:hypothetical protein